MTSTLKNGGVTTVTSLVEETGAKSSITSAASSSSTAGSGSIGLPGTVSSISKKTKLSTGAIVGIAVGGFLVVAVVLGACAWCLRGYCARRGGGSVMPNRDVREGSGYVAGNEDGGDGMIAYTLVPDYKANNAQVNVSPYASPPPVGGPYGPPPVEAPHGWEGRAEMGVGRDIGEARA